MRQYTIVAIWKHKRRRRHRESSHNFQWSTRSTKFVLSQPTLPRKFRITNGGLISFGSSLEMFDYFYKSLHYWPIDLNVNKLLLIRMQNKSETRGKLVFISSEYDDESFSSLTLGEKEACIQKMQLPRTLVHIEACHQRE
ncbi:uncharacterized protein LOC126588341 isoform X1 [Malus sylvestris]|nr:uncharacterized protein LOC103447827 isoform X1 [Malus domestica]XP_050109375.1 uncharacterized protein LOC126588341 isoform X1 [Malus sylvestris]